MLRYTGHPFVDVGVATITAFSRKRDPCELGREDLDAVADFIAENYVVDPLKSFLTAVFPNSGFTQPAFERQPERRQEYAERVLRGYRSGTPRGPDRCVFTGDAATGVCFREDLPPGRAFKQHVPMLTGEGTINFFPGGDAGLPVSGEAMLAIQAMPLGSAKCAGRILCVHSDSPEVMLQFAARFLRGNLRALSLVRASGGKKMPDSGASPRTLLVDTLLALEMARLEQQEERRPHSITAYHLSNSGQSNPLDRGNPPLEIYHIPLQVTRFLSAIMAPDYRTDWDAICQRAWLLAKEKKRKNVEDGEEQVFRKNFLYEDLFNLPDRALGFVRTYLLRIPVRTKSEQDPRRAYSLGAEAELVSWRVTGLFLKEVMNMEQDRIEAIRLLGDRLAEYVERRDDHRFFNIVLTERRYDVLRLALIKADMEWTRQHKEPLITFEQFLLVFEDGAELARRDWRLSRDLVLIRMMELLAERWIGRHAAEIPEVTIGEEEDERTAA